MGNNFPCKFYSLKNNDIESILIPFFEKDPDFQSYYYSHKFFFNRTSRYIQENFCTDTNRNCLGFNITQPRKKRQNWLQMMKTECKKLEKNCHWAKLVSEFLKFIKQEETENYQKKYIAEIYFIDFKTGIFEEDVSENHESNFIPERKKINDNCPIIKVDTLHYSENVKKIVCSHENEKSAATNDASAILNNSLMTHFKTIESEGLDEIEQNHSKLHKKHLSHYKMITNIIEQHLQDVNENPLAKIKDLFLFCFSANYKNENDFQLDEMVIDVQEIIKFLSEENILAFLTCIVFTENDVYDILLRNQQKIEHKTEQSIKSSIERLTKWSPDDFGVDSKYSLTFKTIELFNNKESLKKRSISLDNLIFDNKENCPFQNNDKSFTCGKKGGNLQEFPFSTSIEKLKKINKLKAPIHKLKIISRVLNNIMKAIHNFYSKFNEKFEEKCLEPDEVISILMYIVTQANIDGLYSQCILIEKFVTNKVLSTVSGYQLTHLKAALCLLSNFDENTKFVEY